MKRNQTKTKEQKFLNKIKHALAEADDPDIFGTLLESTAEITISVDINSQVFLFSLILLVDQLDNPHLTVRLSASKLILRSCYSHVKGGFELLLCKVIRVWNELYDYLSNRLDNDQAVVTLYEFARCLNTDMVQLIVTWLPKVLAFALIEKTLLLYSRWIHYTGQKQKEDVIGLYSRVMGILRGCSKDLPTYQWLTVLPQSVSRICHQNEEIVRLVKYIVTTVLRDYPQQGLWIMAAVSKSIVPSRREAAAEIIQAARKSLSQGNKGNNLFIQFATLIDHLIRLCFHAGQLKAGTINISTEFSALKRMMPLEIVMPIQQSLTVNLPTYDMDLSNSLSVEGPSTSRFTFYNLPKVSVEGQITTILLSTITFIVNIFILCLLKLLDM
ncbi:hypothetical protein Vadar_008436 [Vaccinium darrowii]|uniref:Uncharacterized protein n=1 Tax=Vaccinium darrowii TaxID=229202 RepID=A0ACB7WZB2_9ERIC|nr:hypothetical protein Vadar_008436 [Vaccinium darrowii]